MLLNNCKSASIYTLEDAYICDAAVSDIREDSVLLTMEESIAEIFAEENHVTFYDGTKGLLTYFCTFSDYKEFYVSSDVINCSVHCAIGEQLSVVQRRNDLKVPVDIPITVNFASRRERPINVPATIHNISAGGVFFTCRYKFRPGDFVNFSFSPKPGGTALLLTVHILRIQDRDILRKMIGSEADDPALFGYGCRFSDLSSRDEAQVRTFVFRQDLISRRNHGLN